MSATAAAAACSRALGAPRQAAGVAQQRHRPSAAQQRRGNRQAALASASTSEEVTIRRRPPHGIEAQGCGPVDFKVPLGEGMAEDNQPRNILEEIVWHKAIEVDRWRERVPLARVIMAAKVSPQPRDFIGAIQAATQRTGKPGLIAEVKKASPSKGVIQPNFDPVKIAQAYERGGAACLSVLTDAKFFQGSFENLTAIRDAGVQCPLLCKEFVVEAYQVFKARASGADAILLIAAVLPNSDMSYLIKAARSVGLQCLIEVHTIAELERVLALDKLEGCMLGINNRDLQTFKVDLANTKEIMESPAGKQVLERGLVMAGESAIFTPDDVAFVQAAGCSAILVGESIVKQGDPEAAVKTLLELH
ncbi:indole-3-glycerol phosphate chloroplastic-like [Micractinium conductrix]|uniref:indole-3-glycerol-phosphate synthase n=1 Tax=Micractinium conductrix TaxID=554055 RepID=A0A2P6V0Q6_9CHLO|nr:indole-3-glycerol phosphate chloroplastic-like [Micractinium conductrix]|eukprot:PSC67663.1 indole-3-glycerol phosphate chloroplastic-like [Micractinium conductrix]